MYKIEYFKDGSLTKSFICDNYMKVLHEWCDWFRTAGLDVFVSTGRVCAEVNMIFYDVDGSIKEQADFTHKEL